MAGIAMVGGMDHADDFRKALADLLDTIPDDRRSAFMRDTAALFRRQRYDDQRVDFETFRRSRAWLAN